MALKTDALYFKSFSSGSSGNCCFLGRKGAGILIDAGVGVRSIKAALEAEGLGFEDVCAVLITHEHSDHIRSLGSFCKRLRKPVWMSATQICSAPARWFGGDLLASSARTLPESGPAEILPGRIYATPFAVPHDARETLGYFIQFDGLNFVIMTDIGRMTQEALGYASISETVVIEANYDPDMLRDGPYPKELQDRIRGGNGHLSNGECALAVKSFRHEGLRNVFLCHLSAHNNTPELARKAVAEALNGSGARLQVLPRTSPSPLFEL